MGKCRFFTLFLWICPCFVLVADDMTGFWQTMNKETGQPSSVVAVYRYKEEYYGKIIATFNDDGTLYETLEHPISRAAGIEGKPYLCGLDIVWNASPNARGGKASGYVVDPRNGKVYDADIWRKGNNLILRGKVFIFGRNVTWPAFPEQNFSTNFKKPDLSTFVPNTPQANTNPGK